MSAQVHCLLERLAFILMTYDNYQARLFDGPVNVGVFLTMNAGFDWRQTQIQPILERRLAPLYRPNGKVEICLACDTLPFPKDLQNACKLGQ